MVYPGEGRGCRGTTTAAAGGKSDGETNKLKVAYTNVDGLLSSILEIKDYVSSEKPDVLCMMETKLKEEINVNFQPEGFKLWRRDRKGKGGGGGVLIMVKEDIAVEGVQYGDGMAEVISIIIRNNERDRRKIIVAYVPPRTNTWKLEEYKTMQREGGVRMPG